MPWLGGDDDTQSVEPEVMEDIAKDLRLRTGEVSLLGLDDDDSDAPVVGRLRNNMAVVCAVSFVYFTGLAVSVGKLCYLLWLLAMSFPCR